MKFKQLAIASLLCSTSAFSQGYLTPLGSGIEIDKYQFLGESSGGIVIWLKKPISSNPDSCRETEKVYIKNSLPQYKDMVAAIMAAHAQGKKVGFWSTGCGTNYFWGGSITFPLVRDMWVTD